MSGYRLTFPESFQHFNDLMEREGLIPASTEVKLEDNFKGEWLPHRYKGVFWARIESFTRRYEDIYVVNHKEKMKAARPTPGFFGMGGGGGPRFRKPWQACLNHVQWAAFIDEKLSWRDPEIPKEFKELVRLHEQLHAKTTMVVANALNARRREILRYVNGLTGWHEGDTWEEAHRSVLDKLDELNGPIMDDLSAAQRQYHTQVQWPTDATTAVVASVGH